MTDGKRGSRVATLVGVLLVLAFGTAQAGETNPKMGITGHASPPVGYIAFCHRIPLECIGRGSSQAERLTPERWREMEETNALGNLLIKPVSDLEGYKTEEVWAVPGSYGDCEDFVLLKRKWLIERGWPTGALLIAVVFDEFNEGHAVLVARTDRGDFVLDNKTNAIQLWHRTPYRFVKRQSTTNPNRWVRIGKPMHEAVTSAAR